MGYLGLKMKVKDAKLAVNFATTLWLLVPGLSSQFLPLFPIQPVLMSAVVGNIFEK